jgi:hypothetical protein
LAPALDRILNSKSVPSVNSASESEKLVVTTDGIVPVCDNPELMTRFPAVVNNAAYAMPSGAEFSSATSRVHGVEGTSTLYAALFFRHTEYTAACVCTKVVLVV